METDILIVGCGVAGLFCALNMDKNKRIVIITKSKAEESDSFLAQGGICVLTDDSDYEDFFNDTMKAGHFENNAESVKTMIKNSRSVIEELVSYGVSFCKNDDGFVYTREGAHSRPRIMFHEDETGKEITSHLLEKVRNRKNITLIENFTMTDLVCENNECHGIIGHNENGEYTSILADYTILATGGIGGLFKHSTNFEHLTADSIALSVLHNIELENLDYIQIHPTTLYSKNKGRKFLISESVRGEGAVLLNAKGERFVDELLPRDVVTKAIFEQMEKENSDHVFLSLAHIDKSEIINHFPNIYRQCLEEGYDITRESIPVVPAQHYFMGGIKVDSNSKTSMDRLYAIGETSCNGVHGKNRLASNSLLESLVFARIAAQHISQTYEKITKHKKIDINESKYKSYKDDYKKIVLSEIKKERNKNE